MLRITKLLGTAYRYYENSVAQGVEDYYSGHGEAPGYWLGEQQALSELGLTAGAQPQSDELSALLAHGVDPRTGEKLGKGNPKIVGWQASWSAPKSVSLLWALGDDTTKQAIQDAHATAVASGFSYLSDNHGYSRAGHGGVTQIKVKEGIFGVAYRHRTSRAGDPQLHTHLLIPAKVLCEDNVWRSLDGREFLDGAYGADGVYHTTLRAELTKTLGVSWTEIPENGKADIAGVPRSLIDAFSKRSSEIEAELSKQGLTRSTATQAELQIATLRTRAAKIGESTDVELHELWRQEAASYGWTQDSLLEATKDAVRPDEVQLSDQEIVKLSLGQLTQKQSTWSKAEMAQMVSHYVRSQDATDAKAEIERLSELTTRRSVSLSPEVGESGRVLHNWQHRFTSPEVIADEVQLLRGATETVSGSGVEHEVVERHVKATDQLSTAQADAIYAICESDNRLRVLRGVAGTGKTSVLVVARDAWEQSGKSVVGLAPSARAAQQLEEGSGISSQTIDSFLYGIREGIKSLPREAVVVVDEAGMARDRHLLEVVEIVKEAGGVVVLVGDDLQLPAIGRGGGFGLLAEKAATRAELNDVWRINTEWEKEAATALRHGDRSGIDAYLDHNAARGYTDSEEAVRSAVVRWNELRGENTTLLLGFTRSHVGAMNKLAQQVGIDAGEVSTACTAILADGKAYQGDIVITRSNDRAQGVLNGETWKITDVTDDGLLLRGVGNDKQRVVTKEYAATSCELGYASTVHRSQGLTCDRSVLLVDDRWTKELFYVGMTRARFGSEIHVIQTDPFDGDQHIGGEFGTVQETLEKVITKSRRQLSANVVRDRLREELLVQGPEDQDIEAVTESFEQDPRAPEPLDLATRRAEQFAEIERRRAQRSRDRDGWDR